jgi:Tfp pilus assembly protein PilF
MYSNDPMIFENIQTKARVRPEVPAMRLQLNNNLDEVINVIAYDQSVRLPFRQIDLTGATPAQRARFFKMVEDYCAKNVVEYSDMTNNEARQRCLSVQISTLKNNIDRLPDKAASYFILAHFYRNKGDLREAAVNYSKSLESNPVNASAHEGLATFYCSAGMIQKCIAEYRAAIQLGPNWIEPLMRLGWILATNKDPKIRNGKEAVAAAEQANKLTNYSDPYLLDVMAAAYASSGRFSEATTTAERALLIFSQSANNAYMAKQIQNRLQFYKASKIYTEPLPH